MQTVESITRSPWGHQTGTIIHWLVRESRNISIWHKVITSRAHEPAVNHHGSRVGQGLGLDSPNKPQQARGMIGHAVVRPTREVKLSDLPDLMSPSLWNSVTVLNTQSAAQDDGDVVRWQGMRCTDGVKGPSDANRAGLITNTPFKAKAEQGLSKLSIIYQQGCCSRPMQLYLFTSSGLHSRHSVTSRIWQFLQFTVLFYGTSDMVSLLFIWSIMRQFNNGIWQYSPQ